MCALGGPAERVEEVAERLRRRALAADDAAGHFPAMYAGVTAEVARRLRAGQPAGGAGFADPERMARLTELFAGLYLDPHGGTQPLPQCWQAARAVAGDRRLLVVQHLLLGINAHVNHDLPQAVVALAEETGDLQRLRGDFDAVNAVLAAAYRTVIRRLGLATRWINYVAALGGERLFRFSLTVARDQAWTAAERLHHLDTQGRREDVRELDRLVSVLAYLVAFPPTPAQVLVHAARQFEEQNPRVVTSLLLSG